MIAEDEECSQFPCSLPTNSDEALVVGASSSSLQKEKNEDIVVGHCYVTIIKEGSLDTWYIAYLRVKMRMGLIRWTTS